MGNGLLLVVLAILFGGLALLVSSGDGTVFGLQDEGFAALLRLSTVGLVVGASLLFVRHLPIGPALRAAGVWLAFGALLVAGYSFRGEFREIGTRIQASLVPGSVVSVDPEAGQVMATRGFGEQFQLDAEINGTPVAMLVDTGASIVAIDRGTAERAGIDLDALRYTAQIRTANGLARAAPVRLDSLRVGTIEREGVAAVVTEGEGIGIDLLGMSFLGTLSSVDFRGDRIVLTD